MRWPVQKRKPITREEYNELSSLLSDPNRHFSKEQHESAYFVYPLNMRPPKNLTSHESHADYLFKCEICTEIGLIDQWYQIVMSTIGGTLFSQRGSSAETLEKGFKGDNISKLLKGEKRIDGDSFNSSGLNFVDDKKSGMVGYICDHCQVSCYDNI